VTAASEYHTSNKSGPRGKPVRVHVHRWKGQEYFHKKYENGGWLWSRWVDGVELFGLEGVELPLYGHEKLATADAATPVLICEGERDVETAEKLGFLATSPPSGALVKGKKWSPLYTKHLARFDCVIIAEDNDAAGREHAETCARALRPLVGDVRVVRFPELPEKGDLTDWVAAGGTAEDLNLRIVQTPQWQPESAGAADPERLSRVSVGGWDLLQKDIPEPNSIIGSGVFVEGDLGFVIGEGGAGKSQLGVQLAVARALGTDWIGFKVTEGRTGLLMMELDDCAWQKRIRTAAGPRADARLNAISLVCRPSLTGVLALNTDADMAALAQWIRGEGLTMAVLDPLSRVHGLDENKADQMGGLLQRLDALRVDTKCSILVPHHSRKSQAGARDSDLDAGSGSRVFRDFPSFHARLVKKNGAMRVLSFGKVSRAAEPAPVWLAQDPESGVLTVTESPQAVGDANRERVHSALRRLGAEAGCKSDALAAEVGLGISTVKTHLAALETGGAARRTGTGKATLWWLADGEEALR